jgi:hypothetical protein
MDSRAATVTLAIADCRLPIDGLPTADWRFGLTISDWIGDWRLVIRIADCGLASDPAEEDSQSTIVIPNRQSSFPIDNRPSSISIANLQSQSAFANRHSVNLQSAIAIRQCHD